MCDLKIGNKIQALFPRSLLCSGPGSWAGLHRMEYVTWPLLVDLMITRVSVEGFTQRALKWGYLPTNPVVSTADAIECISRCSKTPGLAKKWRWWVFNCWLNEQKKIWHYFDICLKWFRFTLVRLWIFFPVLILTLFLSLLLLLWS